MSTKNASWMKRPSDALARLLLWPGDAVAVAVGAAEPDARMLLRLFVNLAVYAKAVALIALLVA